jgi:flagellar biosynthesis protein
MYQQQQNNEILKKKAAALKYAKSMKKAPEVVAKGRGVVAQKIIEKAKEFDVPFFQNQALANSLLDVNVNDEIPPKLYKAVAEIFIWLLNSEKKAQEIEDERQRKEEERAKKRK